MGFLKDKACAYKHAKVSKAAKYSDEDLEKYTGKSRAELDKWAASAEGVVRWQTAGGANGVIGVGSVGEGRLNFGPEWEERGRQAEWEQHWVIDEGRPRQEASTDEK